MLLQIDRNPTVVVVPRAWAHMELSMHISSMVILSVSGKAVAQG